MTVLIVSKVPASLRGRLTRWMMQLRPGVYVGTMSNRVRERLWARTCASVRSGWALILTSAPTEQGFEIRMHGKAPIAIEDFDGLWLVKSGIPR
jgi:CRISPR-associated protein Cas2